MSLLDEQEPEVVNVKDYCESFGLSDVAVAQVTLHLLLTQSYALTADIRVAAAELGIHLPYVTPTNGLTH